MQLSNSEDIDQIIDKSTKQISRLVNNTWFSRYPCPRYVIYDNESEFKDQFQALISEYGLTHKPTTVKNPTANAILESGHQVVAGMLYTS